MDDPKTCPYYTKLLQGENPKMPFRVSCYKERCEIWVEYWIYPELVEMDTLPKTLAKEKRGCCAHKFKAIRGSFAPLAFVGVVV